MAKSIRILLPMLPISTKNVYVKGIIRISELTVTIFITEFDTNLELLIQNTNEDNVIYGCCTDFQTKTKFKEFSNYLLLNQFVNPQINKLIIDGFNVNVRENCILMLYDYDRFKNSETVDYDTADYFSQLQDLVSNDKKRSHEQVIHRPVLGIHRWLSSSMLYQHSINYLNLIMWLISSIKANKKISIKHGNLILAIMMDVALGYFLLKMVTFDQREVSSMLMGTLEKLVNSLYSLLKWIMGAPAGLKLNMAFNKMLGKYFSYHIQLWWLFLEVSGEKLDTILHMYHYIGYLGFSVQAAIISDMICIATFHSYCIYVYAARLFNIQISGLIALLRLFVGRKYNPLRGGIDSCEYTNQELFVGTVAFTILLLLLPTTTMYYIVFTVFRLLSLIVQYVLAKLMYLVQTLPLYVIALWLANSSKVAGNILIEEVNNKRTSPLVLRVRLLRKPIVDLIKDFIPPVQMPNHVQWTNLLSKILVGKPII